MGSTFRRENGRSRTVNPKAGDYTLRPDDNGGDVVVDSATTCTITVPQYLPAYGFECNIIQKGAGAVVLATSGTAIHHPLAHNACSGQWAKVNISSIAPDVFVISGETAVVDAVAPTVPANLNATKVSDTRIDITWDASTDAIGVTGYDLQRALDSGFSSGLTTINLGNVTSYSNTGLSPSTTYYYRVRAHDAASNNSAYSASDSDTTDAPAPVGVPVYITGQKAIGSAAGPITTAAINTTGASLLVAAVMGGNTLTDSAGNTWTALPASGATQLYYCQSPTTSAAHTFTSTGGGFNGLAVQAFSGTLASGSLDGQSGATASSATVQPGSVTPTADSHLVVTAASSYEVNAFTAPTCDSGFTVTASNAFVGSASYPFGMAYKIVSPAAAVNPTWTFPVSDSCSARIAVFKKA